jgi:DnaJ-class molecular chaperone
MRMTENLYTTLGVTQAASDDEIRKAYRKLAKTCHPDTSPWRQGRRGALQGDLPRLRDPW